MLLEHAIENVGACQFFYTLFNVRYTISETAGGRRAIVGPRRPRLWLAEPFQCNNYQERFAEVQLQYLNESLS